MAKLLKLRRGTTTQHASFTGAEGEVTVDTTKDTAVIHDGSQAGGRPLLREDLSNLPAGQIDNADINASAAISGTKISPDFGSQNVTTTGTLGSDDITITGTKPKVVFEDSNNENDYHIQNDDGTLAIKDVDADVARLTIATNGQTNISGNLDCAQGLDVTGNITATGTASTGQITAKTAQEPQIIVQDSDSGNTGNAAETGISFRDGGGTQQGMVGFHNSGDQDLYVDTASTGNRINFRVGGSTTQLEITSGDVQVTGNIGVSGTVDGRDVAADGTKLDTIETNAKDDQTAAEIRTLVGSASDSNVFTDADHAKLDALTTSNGQIVNGVTATTQSQGDGSTKIATTAYTDTAVSNLVDSSPGALNTLNELAAAINDDASFSTTITNSIATKMPLAGGEFTGNITCENITPDSDSTRNLGSNSVRFANVYADNYYGSAANLTGSFLSGMIIMYNSATAPSGWYLCDGNNGTPDLRDRFIVGAGNSYSLNATGGNNTATDNVSVNVSVSGSTSGGGGMSFVAGIFRPIPYSAAANGHQHSFSGSGTGTDTISVDTRSPYYALTFIMKA